LSLKKRCKILFILGLLNFFTSAPIGFIWILFASIPIFFVFASRSALSSRLRQFNWDVASFMFGFLIGQFNWLVAPVLSEWKFIPLAPFALLIAPVLIGSIALFSFNLFYGFIFILKKRKESSVGEFVLKNNTLLIIIFAIFYILSEYIRGEYLFGGFQWQLFGHLFGNVFFIQILKFTNI
jgi:apolipoprotein N-acyltransferase